MSYLTLEQIPASLRSTPQWVAWRYITRDGKQTKAPVSPHDGSLADSTSGNTWGTFEDAVEACQRDSSLAGVGFVFTADDPYCGVDLDNSIDAEGNIKTWAVDLLAKLDTGDKFRSLWDGNWNDHYNSASEADSSVVFTLAYYTKDAAQIDRIFRQSKLMRSKWDQLHGSETYGATTIAKALGKVTKQYTPKKKRPNSQRSQRHR